MQDIWVASRVEASIHIKLEKPSVGRLPGALRLPLSCKEEGCRSARFGTNIHGHHLLVGGIARRVWISTTNAASIT